MIFVVVVVLYDLFTISIINALQFIKESSVQLEYRCRTTSCLLSHGWLWMWRRGMDGSKVDSFREEILPKIAPSNDLLPLPYVLLFLQLLFYGSFRFIPFQAHFLRYWLTIFGWEMSHFLASGKSTALGKGSSLWKNILFLVLKCWAFY